MEYVMNIYVPKSCLVIEFVLKVLFFLFPVKEFRMCFINTRKCHVNFHEERIPLLLTALTPF